MNKILDKDHFTSTKGLKSPTADLVQATYTQRENVEQLSSAGANSGSSKDLPTIAMELFYPARSLPLHTLDIASAGCEKHNERAEEDNDRGPVCSPQ